MPPEVLVNLTQLEEKLNCNRHRQNIFTTLIWSVFCNYTSFFQVTFVDLSLSKTYRHFSYFSHMKTTKPVCMSLPVRFFHATISLHLLTQCTVKTTLAETCLPSVPASANTRAATVAFMPSNRIAFKNLWRQNGPIRNCVVYVPLVLTQSTFCTCLLLAVNENIWLIFPI